jgi:hypothetical protein
MCRCARRVRTGHVRPAVTEAGDDDIYPIMFGDDAPHSMVAMLTEAEQAS